MSFTSGGDAGVYFDSGTWIVNEYGFPLLKFEDTYLNGNPFNVIPIYGGKPSGPTEAYPEGQFLFIPTPVITPTPVVKPEPVCCAVVIPKPGPDPMQPVPEPAYGFMIVVIAMIMITVLIMRQARGAK